MDYSIFILFLVIIILVIMILAIDLDYKKKLKKISNESNILLNCLSKEMLKITSLDIKATEKLEKFNEILRTNLKVDYSTICLYDGNNFEIKASNIEETYKDSIKDVVEDVNFKSVVTKKCVKYLTTNNDKTLLYKSAIERNIKTAVLLPLCFEDNFLGFVLLESKKANVLNDVNDKDLIELAKSISNFVENVEFQNTIESANIVDTQTSFYNNVYLYTNVRKFLSMYNTSAMIVVKLSNLPNINDIYNRNVGNLLLVKLANATKDVLGENNIYIRYSGLRFIIFVRNSNAETVQHKVELLLSKYKNIYEYVDDEKVSIDTQILIHTLRKQNNIEKEIQKTMSYIDWMKTSNTIKII